MLGLSAKGRCGACSLHPQAPAGLWKGGTGKDEGLLMAWIEGIRRTVK